MPSIPTNELDAGDDSPKLARGSLLLAVQAINNLFSFLDPDTDTSKLSIARNVVVSGNLNVTGTLTGVVPNATTANSAAILTTGRTIGITGDLSYTSPIFDGSGNVNAVGTLATVNSNIGSFGGTSQAVTLTVNAKGLVTSISSAAIAIAASQVTSGTFANGLISQASVTQYQAALSIAESQIPVGSLLARLNLNQTVTGLWSFSQPLSANTLGAHTGNVLSSSTYTNMNAAHLTGFQVFNTSTTTSNTPGNQSAGTGIEVRRSDNTTTDSAGTFQFFVSNDSLNNFWLRKVVSNTSPQPNEVWGNWSRIVTDQDVTSSVFVLKAGDTLTGALTAPSFVGPLTGNASTATSAAKLTTARTIAATGDASWSVSFDGSANSTAGITLATVNSSPVTTSFSKVTTNAKGLITGTTPVVAADITALVNTIYVAKSGDTMTGALAIGNPNVFSSLLEISGPGSTYQTILRYSADITGPGFNFIKSRGTTATATTAVTNGDNLGNVYFQGLDGSTAQAGAIISGYVDGAVSSGTVPTALTFRTSPTGSNGLVERMRITSGGSVGIGTSSPQRKLDVVGDSGIGIYPTTTNGVFTTSISSTTGAVTFDAYSSAAGSAIIFRSSTTAAASTTEKMRLDASGNLGIGTNAPSTKLDVRGSVNVANSTAGTPVIYVTKADSGTANETGGLIQFANLQANNTGRSANVIAGKLLWQFSQPTSGAAQDAAAITVLSDAQSGTSTASSLVFLTATAGAGAAIERMRIDSNGNVGIGGLAPGGQYGHGGTAQYLQIANTGTTQHSQAHLFLASGVTTIAGSAIGSVTWGLPSISNTAALGYMALTTGLDHTTSNPTSFMSWATRSSGALTVEKMRLDQTGNLLLGTTTTTNNTRLSKALVIVNTAAGGSPGISITNYSASSSVSILDFQRINSNTEGTLTAVAANMELGSIAFRGSNGSTIGDGAFIDAWSDAAWTTSSQPGRIQFWTTTAGANSGSIKMTLDNAGRLGIGMIPTAKLNIQSSGSTTTAVTNISQLAGGIQMQGTVAGSCEDGISWSSGSGGGCGISFSRGGTYDTYLKFYTNVNSNNVTGALTERMRIDHTGIVCIGTSNPVGVAGDLNIARTSTQGVIYFGNDANTGRYIFANSTQLVIGNLFTSIVVAGDNTASLGTSSNRFTTVYATTGTINTSDANQKEQITDLSDVERTVATQLKSLIKKFKFKDAVALKGDKARWHVGVIAQEVEQVFTNNNLDARDYGLFCEDEVDGEMRLGVRYEELLAFIISAM